VRVISEDGDALGVMDVRDAVQRARSLGLDLVEIAPNADPPVCRIIDYGKFLYDQKKKQHDAKKKQVTVTVKEIKFRPATDNHDYEYRLKRAIEWLSDGDKVRATISFRGREMSHRELGSKILARLREDLAEYGDPEVLPKMEGYQMFMIMTPKKGKVAADKAAADKKAREAAKGPRPADKVARPGKQENPNVVELPPEKDEDPNVVELPPERDENPDVVELPPEKDENPDVVEAPPEVETPEEAPAPAEDKKD
jgi:translation initiation factor IF-3